MSVAGDIVYGQLISPARPGKSCLIDFLSIKQNVRGLRQKSQCSRN
jgi:hypothetical protein